MIYLQLFFCFLKVGLFSIGGGYACMPLIQSDVVERMHWISMEEYMNLISIAEMTPGPIAVNCATFVGIRIAGIPGAFIATFACILPSCVIVSGLFYIYSRYRNIPSIQSVLSILRCAVVALIFSAGLAMLKVVVENRAKVWGFEINVIGAVLFVSAFAALRKFRWNPILVMIMCGIGNLMITGIMTL